MSDKELRDTVGHRLYVHREFNNLPDDQRRQLALDARQVHGDHLHSAEARRMAYKDLIIGGAVWAEAVIGWACQRLEKLMDDELRIGASIAREKEKGDDDNDKPIVPGQRIDPPGPVIDTDDDVPRPKVSWSDRDRLTLLERYCRGRFEEIQQEKEDAARHRVEFLRQAREMTNAQKGHAGAISLTAEIRTAYAHYPDADGYEEVMRNAGLTFKRFGITARFFEEQLGAATAEDAEMVR